MESLFVIPLLFSLTTANPDIDRRPTQDVDTPTVTLIKVSDIKAEQAAALAAEVAAKSVTYWRNSKTNEIHVEGCTHLTNCTDCYKVNGSDNKLVEELLEKYPKNACGTCHPESSIKSSKTAQLN